MMKYINIAALRNDFIVKMKKIINDAANISDPIKRMEFIHMSAYTIPFEFGRVTDGSNLTEIKIFIDEKASSSNIQSLEKCECGKDVVNGFYCQGSYYCSNSCIDIFTV